MKFLKRTRGLGALALAAAVLVGGMSFPLQAPAFAQDEAPAEPTQITEGHVIWGIKASWRNYAGNGTMKDGVEAVSDGGYKWPVKTGTYDAATKTLKLALGGSIRYTLYCESYGPGCVLDSTFSNLRVEIGPNAQVIRGDYSGRARPSGDGDYFKNEIEHSKDVVLAELDIYDAQVKHTEGQTTWEKIPAIAGSQLALYAAGTAIDPVTITYRGAGDKPELVEKFDVQGAPRFERDTTVKSWVPTEQARNTFEFLASDKETIIVVEKRTTYRPTTVKSLIFTALNSKTLEPYSSQTVQLGEVSNFDGFEPQFDQKTNTVFFYDKLKGSDDKFAVVVKTATFDLQQKQFVVTDIHRKEVVEKIHPLSVYWSPVGSELFLVVEKYNPEDKKAPSKGTEEYLLSSLQKTGNDWAATDRSVKLTTELEEINKYDYGAAVKIVYRTLQRGYTLPNGDILIGTGHKVTDAQKQRKPLGMHLMKKNADGNFVLEAQDPETLAPAQYFADWDMWTDRNGYKRFATSADGSLVAYEPHDYGATAYLQVTDAGVQAKHITYYKSYNASGAYFAADSELGFDYTYDASRKVLISLKDKQVLSEQLLTNGQLQSTFIITGDHALITSEDVLSGSTPQPFVRYNYMGLTPLVTTQPAAEQTVKVASGTDVAAAALSVAYTATGESSVHWQQKLPGEQRFKNVPGATGATFAPELAAAQNGVEYRAVITNSLGKVVSNVAKVKVEIDPSLAPKRGAQVLPSANMKFTDVNFTWEINKIVQSKPHAGVASYLSAGVSDGTAATWRGEADGVQILHVSGEKRLVVKKYEDRGAFLATDGKQLVSLSKGVGEHKTDGSLTVSWPGVFSVNMYDGLVPFTMSNLRLAVDKDGTGTLKADLEGYGSSMSNPGKKTALPKQQNVTVATFKNVNIDTAKGFSIKPDYRGVKIEITGDAKKQDQDKVGWGAWPQEFVNFQVATGLSSYWYSSGSDDDSKKAPSAFFLNSFDAAQQPPQPPAPQQSVKQSPGPHAGQAQEFNLDGDAKVFEVTFAGDFKDLVGYTVDGVKPTAEQAQVRSGSTIFTLTADYLRSLPVGEHVLRAEFKEGENFIGGAYEFKFKTVKGAHTHDSSAQKGKQLTNTGADIFVPAAVALMLVAAGLVVSRRVKTSL